MTITRIEVEKNKIDLEHSDLIEQRNAVCLLEAGFIPIVLALFDFLKIAPSDAGIAVIGIAIILVVIDNWRGSLNRRLRDKQNELNRLRHPTRR